VRSVVTEFAETNKVLVIFWVIFAVFLFSGVAAQDIMVNNNLEFGSVFPGVPKTISKKTPGEAAEFRITGTPNAEITISFTLQTYMHTSGSNMALQYSATDCAMDSSALPDQANPGHDNLNPWQTMTYRIGSAGLTIWLGATVVPISMQKPGNYSATITLTVAYTGN
jgi:hypothetical protein